MSSRAFVSAVACVVFIAVLAGLLTIGSPGEARRDRYDERRYNDLAFLSQALLCENQRVASPALPEELTLEGLRSYCGGIEVLGPELIDEETGKRYSYTRSGDGEFVVCAEFHNAEKVARLRRSYPDSRSSFNPDEGCVRGQVR